MKIKTKLYISIFAVVLAIFSGCKPEEEPVEPKVHKVNTVLEDMSVEELTEASLENPEASYLLGQIFDYGLLEQRQSAYKAKEYYNKSLEQGNMKAAVALAYMYMNGCGIDKDLVLAKELIDSSIEDIPEARLALARLYLDEDYEDYNPEEAYRIFDELSSSGNLEALYYTSYLKEHGLGCVQDFVGALSGYMAITFNDITQLDIEEGYIVNASYTRLGLMNINGEGIEKDYEKALEYFDQAAENGYAPAMYYKGILYEIGDEKLELDPDYEKALACYEDAASNDYAPAINQIGYLYCKGLGVDIDYDKAFYYQKLASAQGYAPAQINLGYLYENGLGCEKNLEIAKSYYSMAKSGGYEGASSAITRLEEQLVSESDSQID